MLTNLPIPALAIGVVLGLHAAVVSAADYYVASGGSGNGTPGSPFGSIQSALNVAQPGDVVHVAPGTYAESLRSARGGTPEAPITLRAEGPRGSVVVSAAATVLRIDHAHLVVEGLAFDGRYAAADAVDVNSGATGLVLRNVEVRRSSKDCIDMAGPQGVTIEGSLVHHCLNAAGGRTDAHGIVAGAVRDLTIRGTEIHTFSGDAFQVDPGRAAAGWDNVRIERSTMWLAPLPSDENGFPAGTVPGENAVDTKVNATAPRARLVIRDVETRGFRGGLISNMAAFNLKENVDALLEGVTVHDSEIAFRLRGPTSGPGAWVRIQNSVVYDVDVAVRYEDNIENVRLFNTTFGADVTRPFKAASSNSAGLSVRNLLLLGASLPPEASDPSNRAVSASAFVDAARHDYHLAALSPAIDWGIPLEGVESDKDGVARPQGKGYDAGAYEFIPLAPGAPADIVLHAGREAKAAGDWRTVGDPSAASSVRVWHPDAGASKERRPLPSPTHYFDLSFHAEADVAYRVWIRGRADGDSTKNDQAFLQFSSSVDEAGRPVWRIGTSDAIAWTLRECARCPLAAWGWQDNASGIDALGPTVSFQTSGVQTLRVQTREDGLSIDQVVLSPLTYLFAAPGAATNDTTVLPATR